MKIADLDFWVQRYEPPEDVTLRELPYWQACLKLAMLKMMQAIGVAEDSDKAVADAITIAQEDVDNIAFDLRTSSAAKVNIMLEKIDRAARGEILMLLQEVATDD